MYAGKTVPELNRNQMSMTFARVGHFLPHSSYTDCIFPSNDVSAETAHIPWMQSKGGSRTFHVG